MLKRIVAERVRRSKRGDKYRLDDDGGEGEGLTHRVSFDKLACFWFVCFCGFFSFDMHITSAHHVYRYKLNSTLLVRVCYRIHLY